MINLLPPQQKQAIIREEKYRVFLILISLGFLFLISLFLILLSLRVYISGQAEAQRIFTELEKEQFQASEFRNLEKEIALINQDLSELDSFYKSQLDWTEILEKLSKTVPEEIYLTTFFLNPFPKEEDRFQVSLTGWCPAREILFEFKKVLEAEPDFKEVYFPPSNWAKAKDIDFNATFKLEK